MPRVAVLRVALALLPALVLSGCYDWNVGGNPAGSSGADPAEPCPLQGSLPAEGSCRCADETCRTDCPAGTCTVVCEASAVCNSGCSGGNCRFVCAADSTCDFECAEGGCRFECAEGATCDNACSGGDCTFRCAPTALCSNSCSGGGCNDAPL